MLLLVNWGSIDRRAVERDQQWLEQLPPDEALQRARKAQDQENLKREDSLRKKDSEEKVKAEAQDRLGRLFHPHPEPAKPSVQTPWSTAGRNCRPGQQTDHKTLRDSTGDLP